MIDQTKTDSLFTSNMDYVIGMDTWSDLRLIHESESGWCLVYTGLYRGRRVAIKGLKREFQSSQFHRSLLYKEFAVLSGLSHQNIVSALWLAEVPDIGEAILMDYIDGITLADYLRTNPTIGCVQIVDIVRQLCSAVAYMHSRQTIHCDLKPSNIIITSSGFVKVIDFGMSRGNGFERLDFTGGTNGFTAPENFDSESKASAAVDIYSIGKILEQMDSKCDFKDVWRKCLLSDPEKRPASANWISERLNAIYLKSRQRKSLYRAVSVFLGIAVVLFSVFLIWRIVPHLGMDDKVSENIHAVDFVPVDGYLLDSTPSPAAIVAPTSLQIINAWDTIQESTLGIVDELDTDTIPFKNQLTEKLKQVVEIRFKQHLELIDTMTTVRSNELQGIGYWRWLAKKDMRRWLEEKLDPDNVRIEETMKDVDRWIDWEADFSYRKGIESSHRADAIKRCPELAPLSIKQAYYEGIDILVVSRLGEDGIWRDERIKVPIQGHDPESTMKIKHEYMQKALKD